MRLLLQKTDNRLLFAIVAAGGLAALGGCSGIAIQGVGTQQYFETRLIAGDEADIYHACRNALEAMHFSFQSGSVGSGKLAMESAVQPGGTAETVRQRLAKVRLKYSSELEHEVSIGFWEYSEDVSIGGTVTAGGRLMRGGPLYEAFWETLEELKPDTPGLDEPEEPAAATP